jgi:hypothetical protein
MMMFELHALPQRMQNSLPITIAIDWSDNPDCMASVYAR